MEIIPIILIGIIVVLSAFAYISWDKAQTLETKLSAINCSTMIQPKTLSPVELAQQKPVQTTDTPQSVTVARRHSSSGQNKTVSP